MGNYKTQTEDIQEVLTDHNVDINNLKERMTDQERRAAAPIYAVITPEMQESVADAIAAQVMERIEDCELPAPDISEMENRIEAIASLGFAKAVEKYKIRIETDCIHRVSPEYEKKMNEAVDTMRWAINMLDETKIAPWRVWLRDIFAALFLPVALSLGISIIVYCNSAQYWGQRYYDVCNHHLQQKEFLLSHRSDAFESVLAFFDAGGDEKKKIKAFIRGEEQYLKRLELEKKGEKSNGKKP